ncbi:MAG: replication-associated recombination protein A [Actinobacteria bacterium]|jgi:putative ATPase|nr:replication-associated recombination protein A [Actinomycetota bacterium]
MAEDLFSAAFVERISEQAPLAVRMRPRTLSEIVGQKHLLAPGAPFRTLVEMDRLPSTILWGPPGCGKTTLAAVIAASTSREFVALSAVSAGVKEVRDVIEGAKRRLGEYDRGTIVFIDEVHRFNKGQQDALLPAVEQGVVTMLGATTENPFFEVNGSLLSRSTLWRLEPLSVADLMEIVRRALSLEEVEADDDAVQAIAELAGGDGRSAIATVETLVNTTEIHHRITLEDVHKTREWGAFSYGKDDHYDVISAFIKSIRGSDPDAGLYWLARMLDGGEDPKFIARRLIILASEDIGLADSNALSVAVAAQRAVEVVGLPEAALNLAHAVAYLSSAPKSNSVTVALSAARSDTARFPSLPVPNHLRDRSYEGARQLGRGEGYLYPHNSPAGFIDQPYRPPQVQGSVYYVPSEHGAERAFGEFLSKLWGRWPRTA